jgi:DNA-directed RNA polymerase subunit RPC12/RpoP
MDIKDLKFEDLKAFALELFDRGFNIIPQNDQKQPLCSWGSEKRIERSELERLLEKASGFGVVGGTENPFKGENLSLFIMDIDNPKDFRKKYPHCYFLLEKTIKWASGLRCPYCYSKQVEKVGEDGYQCKECERKFKEEEAKRGIGALFLIDSSEAPKSTIRTKDIELLYNNLARLPPSKHPSGVLYQFITPFDFNKKHFGIYKLDFGEIEEIINEIKKVEEEEKEESRKVVETKREGKEETKELREINALDITKAVDILKGIYTPGNRQFIWFSIAGWGAKARISPVSIAGILKLLYADSKDEDPISMRLGALVYSYKKAGIDLAPYEQRLKEVFGISPFGLEREIDESEVKGKSGIQELLESTSTTKEDALGELEALEEIFGVASPYKDSVFAILNYEEHLFALANLKDLVVARVSYNPETKGVHYKEKVFNGAPTEVIVYENPFTEERKLKIKWEAKQMKPRTFTNMTIPEIVERLKIDGFVTNGGLARDVLSALIGAYIEKGRAIIKEESDQPGFYYTKGKIIAVKIGEDEKFTRLKLRKPEKEELKEALLYLDELTNNWFAHIKPRFARLIRVGLIAPFGYAYKQQFKKFIKQQFLYGTTRSGKSTITNIIKYIWGLNPSDSRVTIGGGSANTEAMFGEKIGFSTFPIEIKEPAGIFLNEAVKENVKTAIEDLVVRGRMKNGVPRDYPALAFIFFTSNIFLPKDDAILSRLDVNIFTKTEREKIQARQKEFDKRWVSETPKLKAIGEFVSDYILKNGLKEDWEELVIEILKEAYTYAGLPIPEWITLKEDQPIGSVEEMDEEVTEIIRNVLVEKINETFSKNVSKIEELVGEGDRENIINKANASFQQRAYVVLEFSLIPWMIYKRNKIGEEWVYITSGIIREIGRDIGFENLKLLADLLGWEYTFTSLRTGERPKTNYYIKIRFNDLLQFLSPEIKEEGEGNEEDV